jgi:hypothetical protein
LIVLVAVVALAQAVTDFSGDWVLASLDVAADVPRELRVQVTTRGGTQIFRVDRRGLTGTRTSEYRIGIEGGHVSGTQQTRSSARWVAERLVIREGTYAGPLGDNAQFTETEEVWSVDSSGHLAISITTRARGVAPKATQATYKRR